MSSYSKDRKLARYQLSEVNLIRYWIPASIIQNSKGPEDERFVVIDTVTLHNTHKLDCSSSHVTYNGYAIYSLSLWR